MRTLMLIFSRIQARQKIKKDEDFNHIFMNYEEDQLANDQCSFDKHKEEFEHVHIKVYERLI